jgi:2-oxoglutarate dehydrogenase E2 component (dihydrolipoamide succinyltransferase)
MSFFVKGAVAAIQDNPIVNAVIDGTDILHRNYIDISVAVATPNGLMVPILRDCQTMKMHEI